MQVWERFCIDVPKRTERGEVKWKNTAMFRFMGVS